MAARFGLANGSAIFAARPSMSLVTNEATSTMPDPAEQSDLVEPPNSAERPGVASAASLTDSSLKTALVEPDVRVASECRADKSEAPDISAPLWLRRSDQLFVGTLLVVLLALLTAHWLKLSRWGTAPVEITSLQPREYFYSLDINTASWVEWAQLDGIGEKLAKRIVADRVERGLFRDASDVGRVRGIHLKQLETMKPFLRGGTANEVTQP